MKIGIFILYKEVINIETKFLIVAPSGAGKDTMANNTAELWDLKVLVSYTTRPRRFPEENSHIFIDADTANFIKMNEIIIAHTQIGEYQYFSTLPQFLEADIYIIDPKGIDYLENNQELIKDIRLVKIYIKTDADVRQKRTLGIRKDSPEVYKQRTKDEFKQFENFLKNEQFDWVINNNDTEAGIYMLCKIISFYI
jgi:guanylate kinase